MEGNNLNEAGYGRDQLQATWYKAVIGSDDQEAETRYVEPNKIMLHQNSYPQYPPQNIVQEPVQNYQDYLLIQSTIACHGVGTELVENPTDIPNNQFNQYNDTNFYNEHMQRGIKQSPDVSDSQIVNKDGNSVSFMQSHPNSYSSYDQVSNQQLVPQPEVQPMYASTVSEGSDIDYLIVIPTGVGTELVENPTDIPNNQFNQYNDTNFYNEHMQRGIKQSPDVSDSQIVNKDGNSVSFMQSHPNSYSSYDQVSNQQLVPQPEVQPMYASTMSEDSDIDYLFVIPTAAREANDSEVCRESDQHCINSDAINAHNLNLPQPEGRHISKTKYSLHGGHLISSSETLDKLLSSTFPEESDTFLENELWVKLKQPNEGLKQFLHKNWPEILSRLPNPRPKKKGKYDWQEKEPENLKRWLNVIKAKYSRVMKTPVEIPTTVKEGRVWQEIFTAQCEQTQ
nr:uncharacterized protein LOC113808073 isoform X1 [Penaeus vannamei]